MSELGNLVFNFINNISGISDNLATALTFLIVTTAWIIVGIIIISVVKYVLKKLFKIRKGDNRTLTIGKLINSITKYTVSFIILLIILSELGVDIAPLIASAGVLGLAIGFGAQSIVKDFISGFFIIFENSFNVGDVVQINGFKGQVTILGLRTTRLLNWKGEVKIITNGDINEIINFSKSFSVAVVEFSVSYDSDLEEVKNIIIPFLDKLSDKYSQIIEKPSFSGVTSLGDSGIVLRITSKTISNNHYQLERDIRKEVVELLKLNNIEIPFPQIVVHNNEN